MKCDLSIVMPCYNEEKTIALCVQKALRAMKEHHINGEVVVCDNNSTDASLSLARQAGARVVLQSLRGYGNAYQKGFSEATGTYIIMADSDLTYDFEDIPRFYRYLRQGYDFVMGSRLLGKIEPGAMPWLHRYIGNPLLTTMLNVLFFTNFSDAHCGMRGFKKSVLLKMNLQTSGMEFASEMVIRAAKLKLKITEIPINYYARPGESYAKLHSFNDGWRHVKFMLKHRFSDQREYLVKAPTTVEA